jgi:peptidyl-prolyl cis-trans isomerase D
MLNQWHAFLKGLKQERLNQKYFNLIKNSLYVTSLEAREDYIQRNKTADFSYVALDYASIPDNQVKISDDDYKEYYEENKQQFKNTEEIRSFKYVVFDANPSRADSAEMKSKIDKLAAEFKASTNDSLFVSINSDTRNPVTYVRKGQLDPAIGSVAFTSSAGAFIGPVYSNGTYKIAKVIDVKTVPDSAKSAHILINPTAEGGLDKAKAKADSIADLIRKGADFAALAKKFGTDGTKDKGGELGYYSYGAQGLDKDYNDAIFSGNVGDLKVITSQYGVHVIKIQDQKGSSKVAKVAVIDKGLTSSNKTRQAVYSKAAAFLGSVDDAKDFDENAKKHGLPVLDAGDVTSTQSSIPGLENVRELVRWVFKADQGDVSDQVYSFDNKYVVAKVTGIKEEGIPPIEQVKSVIEPKVRDLVKARMLREKIEKVMIGASSINQIAQKVGTAPVPVQNIVFANPVLPNAGQENKVVGTVFGLQPGKISKKPIYGEKGVYVVSVNKFSNPAPLTNTYHQKTQMMKTLGQQAQGHAFRVLRDNGNVKDYRGKFF